MRTGEGPMRVEEGCGICGFVGAQGPRMPVFLVWLAAAGGLGFEPLASAQALSFAEEAGAEPLAELTITADRLDLLGKAASASEGVVTDQEIQETPAYRPGQLLETVPGLIVTLHSGEGKANQFLMRGYNLDHGTDLATFVDGMPINQPTHAHGQGYSDLNFLIPELVDAIDYTKGPYYAGVGDFGSVGSVNAQYRDSIPSQITASIGTLDFQRTLAAGSHVLGDGRLLAALELQHYDGPFTTPDDARKGNAVLSYSGGDERNGYSITGMYYHQQWTSTTDIPLRAIEAGVVANRFGSLDPTDGGRAQRASLSAHYRRSSGAGEFALAGWLIDNQLHLYNDFTHFLIDPVRGDQEAQFENRHVLGGSARYTWPAALGPIDNELEVGTFARYDSLAVGRLPTAGRTPQLPEQDPPSFADSDHVYLFGGSAYIQATTHWTSWWRTVLGLRSDYQHGTDVDYLARLHEAAG